jgi:hypothetical protein
MSTGPIHPVAQKLRQAILPYLISATALKWRPLYVAHFVYVYTHDLLAALAGFGISHPLAKLITGESNDLPKALEGMPPWLKVLTVTAIVLWAILKVVVTRENGEKRSALARSCRKEFRGIERRVLVELSKKDPMPGLDRIQDEISTIVDRHIAEDSWPWAGPKPNIAGDVNKRLKELCDEYQNNWTPPPATKVL